MAAHPVVVVGPEFVLPHALDLIITKKHWTLNSGEFKVKDLHGNIVFTVEAGDPFSMRPRGIIRDAAGNIILTLRLKRSTTHSRWEAFRGSEDAVASEDQLRQRLLFSVKNSSVFYSSNKLDVFLASNVQENVKDFRVKQGFFERGCAIYLGDGRANSILIAQTLENQSLKDILRSGDVYVVSVSANVDFAFITALTVLFHEIHETSHRIHETSDSAAAIDAANAAAANVVVNAAANAAAIVAIVNSSPSC
ncbi:hypothetical protein Ancab_028665 [Ancistrocladus abbreviatus]